MSKKVKALIEKDLEKRLDGVDAVAVINPRGLDAIRTNTMRRKLAEKGVKITVVKNTLARRTGGRVGLAGFEALLDGPSALVYGVSKGDGEFTAISTVCRLLLDEKKKLDTLEMRGVFFDGSLYHGEQGVEKVSKFPTREEAVAEVLGAILGPGASLAAATQGPGGALAGILKAIEDKHGEAPTAE